MCTSVWGGGCWRQRRNFEVTAEDNYIMRLEQNCSPVEELTDPGLQAAQAGKTISNSGVRKVIKETPIFAG